MILRLMISGWLKCLKVLAEVPLSLFHRLAVLAYQTGEQNVRQEVGNSHFSFMLKAHQMVFEPTPFE